jgi:hypothetical protein
MKTTLFLLLISQLVFSKTTSHQLTLISMHGNKKLILNEIRQNKTFGHFVGLHDNKSNEAFYQRIEKKDFQKRTLAISNILKKVKRTPSTSCFEKLNYSLFESGKTLKKIDLCWEQISLSDRNKILRWWKSGL